MKDEELKLRLSINYYPKRERGLRGPWWELKIVGERQKKRKGEKSFSSLQAFIDSYETLALASSIHNKQPVKQLSNAPRRYGH
jgi:hypothetical protein